MPLPTWITTCTELPGNHETPFCRHVLLCGLVSEDDEHHEAATEWLRDSLGEFVTTEYVLCEIGNAFAKAREKHLFIHIMESLLKSLGAHIVPARSNLLKAGYSLFKGRLDKDWSLTDCISFVVMRREGLTDALTADKHFEQAGFNKLL